MARMIGEQARSVRRFRQWPVSIPKSDGKVRARIGLRSIRARFAFIATLGTRALPRSNSGHRATVGSWESFVYREATNAVRAEQYADASQVECTLARQFRRSDSAE